MKLGVKTPKILGVKRGIFGLVHTYNMRRGLVWFRRLIALEEKLEKS
ncbi:hypothetical protein P8X24_09625 [Pyrococcus kukulkanii]